MSNVNGGWSLVSCASSACAPFFFPYGEKPDMVHVGLRQGWIALPVFLFNNAFAPISCCLDWVRLSFRFVWSKTLLGSF